MEFNEHILYAQKHAFLSPSRHSWLHYDEEKLDSVYINWKAAQRGTEIHAIAAQLIKLGIQLKDNHQTLNMYVNDAIGFRMTPEVCLVYSDNVFGTADTISFRDILRIHDLKTGKVPASMEQLKIYAALFCLEYNHEPFKTPMELRIYQNNEKFCQIPDPEEIIYIQAKIIACDKRIEEIKKIGG